MDSFWSASLIPVIMPILTALFVLVIAVVLIVVYGKTKQMQMQSAAISQKSFEQLAEELKADNTAIKSELADIKETLNSINKMMKDIE